MIYILEVVIVIYKAYAIFDSAVGAYMTPFFRRSKGEVLRELTDLVNISSDNGIYRHPDQYFVYEIGTFDDSKGIVVMYTNPESLGCAVEFRKES